MPDPPLSGLLSLDEAYEALHPRHAKLLGKKWYERYLVGYPLNDWGGPDEFDKIRPGDLILFRSNSGRVYVTLILGTQYGRGWKRCDGIALPPLSALERSQPAVSKGGLVLQTPMSVPGLRRHRNESSCFYGAHVLTRAVETAAFHLSR